MSKGRRKDAGTEGSISILEQVGSEARVRRVERGNMARPGLALFAKESGEELD